jgi:hypothetical protein
MRMAMHSAVCYESDKQGTCIAGQALPAVMTGEESI